MQSPDPAYQRWPPVSPKYFWDTAGFQQTPLADSMRILGSDHRTPHHTNLALMQVQTEARKLTFDHWK